MAIVFHILTVRHCTVFAIFIYISHNFFEMARFSAVLSNIHSFAVSPFYSISLSSLDFLLFFFVAAFVLLYLSIQQLIAAAVSKIFTYVLRYEHLFINKILHLAFIYWIHSCTPWLRYSLRRSITSSLPFVGDIWFAFIHIQIYHWNIHGIVHANPTNCSSACFCHTDFSSKCERSKRRQDENQTKPNRTAFNVLQRQ